MTETVRATWRTVPLTRADVDLTNPADVRRVVGDLRPWAIVNCAGYNHVDDAEDDAVTALEANAFAVRTLASAQPRPTPSSCTTAAISCSTARPIGPIPKSDPPKPAQRVRGVEAARRMVCGRRAAITTCCASRACLAALDAPQEQPRSNHRRDRRASRRVRVFADRVVSPSYVVGRGGGDGGAAGGTGRRRVSTTA